MNMKVLILINNIIRVFLNKEIIINKKILVNINKKKEIYKSL